MMQFDRVIIDVTTRCNLECHVCYSAGASPYDLPWEILEGMAKSMNRKVVSLSGGEPTLRADLPEIIRLFNKRNTVFLITNGLRLADSSYVRELRKAGLKYISFSFNGFSDKACKAIHGVPLCDVKLQALNNIKQNRIATILSVLVVPGINEEELRPIFDYCLSNTDFIRELRIRSMLSFGRYLHGKKYSLYELRDLVCRQFNLGSDDIIAEEKLQEKVTGLANMEKSLKSCSAAFHIKNTRRGVIPMGRYCKNTMLQDRRSNPASLFYILIRTYGFIMVSRGILKTVLRQEIPWVHNSAVLKVALRSWPEEINSASFISCRTGYYSNGKIMPFCYAHNVRTRQCFEDAKKGK